jgi:hypothetical protein
VVGPLPNGKVDTTELTDLSTDYVWSDPHFPFGH